MSDKSSSALGSVGEASGVHGIADTPAETIADNLDRPSAPAPYPKRIPPWSTPEARALRRLRRPFVRNYWRRGNPNVGKLTERAVAWLLPWDLKNYPGKRLGASQLLGVAPESVRSARDRTLLGVGRIERLASEIERLSEIGLRLAAELRSEVERKRRVGRPRGLQIIGEDGMRKHQARRGRSKRRVVSAAIESGR